MRSHLNITTQDGALRIGRLPFVRDLNASNYLEIFLVAAVTAVLVIRFFLYMSGYPQVGNSTLHIAHMLWGGLLMLISLSILLIYTGSQWRFPTALIGGVGFGIFIDELGKFITEDNDYFFRPTIALIYLIFLAIYFAGETIQHRRAPSQTEYLSNAIASLNSLATGTLTTDERDRALYYLQHCDPSDPLVASVHQQLASAEELLVPRRGLYRSIKEPLARYYEDIVRRPWFARALAAVFIFQGIGIIGQTLSFDFLGLSKNPALSFLDFIQFAGLAASSLFILQGIYRLFRNRRLLEAYRSFKHSLLITILVTQFFEFADSQLRAIFGFALNLAFLVAIEYILLQEQQREREGWAPDQPSGQQAVAPETAPATGD